MLPTVDILLLTREPQRPPDYVLDALRQQQGIRCVVHQVVGRARASDANRYETIARARNAARRQGSSPWAMFLDDDVVLAPDCIRQLVEALQARPRWGALAADYLGDSAGADASCRHVGMGATLFRRAALKRIPFRWEDNKCECRCCCEDLQRIGLRIGYWPAARAKHVSKQTKAASATAMNQSKNDAVARQPTPRILVATDGNHVDRFRHFFLRSLQATENHYPVTVAGYGLTRSDFRLLDRHPRVAEVVSIAGGSSESPAVRRVREFRKILAEMPSDTPVAWWDAGDVLFQGSIAPLWKIVSQNPQKLMAAREPESHPKNRAVIMWTSSIRNVPMREKVYQLLSKRPFLNSGFVAGTARYLAEYLGFARKFLDVTELWEDQPMDQLAFNYFCHTYPHKWREVREDWNYCLAYRGRGRLQKRRRNDPDWHQDMAMFPRFVDDRRRTIPVVHGNADLLARTLKQWWAVQR